MPGRFLLTRPIVLLLLLGGSLPAGCGLTVTSERPLYEDLNKNEQTVVQIVLQELRSFNNQLKTRTKTWSPPVTIDRIVNKDKIHVSFHGLIFSANLGDEVIHVSTWQNLGSTQQALVQKWFAASGAADAKAKYEKFFYKFMAVVQGAKQFMYEALTPTWVFENRSLFNIERDSIRTALAHYQAVGRKTEIWAFLTTTCTPVITQHHAAYNAKFTKKYLNENFPEIFDPKNPTGYMYFLCRWIGQGKKDVEGMSLELEWLRDLPI